jgi:hypothetical protein
MVQALQLLHVQQLGQLERARKAPGQDNPQLAGPSPAAKLLVGLLALLMTGVAVTLL